MHPPDANCFPITEKRLSYCIPLHNFHYRIAHLQIDRWKGSGMVNLDTYTREMPIYSFGED
jgi:hypothetical protein